MTSHFSRAVLHLILAGNAAAAVNAPDVPRYVIGSGGGRSSMVSFVLDGTMG